jgi:hypothetical protein
MEDDVKFKIAKRLSQETSMHDSIGYFNILDEMYPSPEVVAKDLRNYHFGPHGYALYKAYGGVKKQSASVTNLELEQWQQQQQHKKS